MYRALWEPAHVLDGGAGAQIAVECVPGLETDFLARGDLEHGLHIGVPTIVAGPGLVAEMLRAIDSEALYATQPIRFYYFLVPGRQVRDGRLLANKSRQNVSSWVSARHLCPCIKGPITE